MGKVRRDDDYDGLCAAAANASAMRFRRGVGRLGMLEVLINLLCTTGEQISVWVHGSLGGVNFVWLNE